MTINLGVPNTNQTTELKPRITVIGVGGAGGNAINNMIESQLEGVDFVAANTDAQALKQSLTERRVQLGVTITQGLGAGSRPDIGRAAAEEAMEDILEQIKGANMAFIAAGMGGGPGTGAEALGDGYPKRKPPMAGGLYSRGNISSSPPFEPVQERRTT